jgi:hypothetical protein
LVETAVGDGAVRAVTAKANARAPARTERVIVRHGGTVRVEGRARRRVRIAFIHARARVAASVPGDAEVAARARLRVVMTMEIVRKNGVWGAWG